jgi:RNA polymerase sigma factor (sigma-70 family)
MTRATGDSVGSADSPGNCDDDAALLGAVADGDRVAFDALYRTHVDRAHAWARRIVVRRADAADVVSEAFAAVWGAVCRGAGPTTSFDAYLRTTVVRCACTHVRVTSREVLLASADVPGDWLDRSVATAHDAHALPTRFDAVVEAFASLPDRSRSVIGLAEFHGLKPADIAAEIGVSANAAAALLYRARRQLKLAYERRSMLESLV